MSVLTEFGTSFVKSQRTRLETMGDQLLFYVKALAWIPKVLKDYRKEVWKTLAEVVFGVGALSVIAGTVGVIAFLAFFAGIAGGYFFTVIVQGGSAGAFLASFTSLATLTDIYVAMIKAAIFGFMAAIVGAYKGLNAGGGPSGVGRAVNEAVIIAFMVLFALNSIITAIYFQVVPQNGL